VEIDLAANDLQCDCLLVDDLRLLEKVSERDGSWLAPSNMADWRQLSCRLPDAAPSSVAQFVDTSNCTSERPPTPKPGSSWRGGETEGRIEKGEKKEVRNRGTQFLFAGFRGTQPESSCKRKRVRMETGR